MLNKNQLDALDINPTALELVPEAVAREYCVLAVSVVDKNLHLVVPNTARELITSEGDTIDRLRFILNRAFTFDIADRSDLLPVVTQLRSAILVAVSETMASAFIDR